MTPLAFPHPFPRPMALRVVPRSAVWSQPGPVDPPLLVLQVLASQYWHVLDAIDVWEALRDAVAPDDLPCQHPLHDARWQHVHELTYEVGLIEGEEGAWTLTADGRDLLRWLRACLQADQEAAVARVVGWTTPRLFSYQEPADGEALKRWRRGLREGDEVEVARDDGRVERRRVEAWPYADSSLFVKLAGIVGAYPVHRIRPLGYPWPSEGAQPNPAMEVLGSVAHACELLLRDLRATDAEVDGIPRETMDACQAAIAAIDGAEGRPLLLVEVARALQDICTAIRQGDVLGKQARFDSLALAEVLAPLALQVQSGVTP